MSRTEREAISAGTVTWEGDLFRGNPNWDTLLAHEPAKLTAEEEAFINGPVEKLCAMSLRLKRGISNGMKIAKNKTHAITMPTQKPTSLVIKIRNKAKLIVETNKEAR